MLKNNIALKRILKLIGPYRRYLAAAVAGALLNVVLSLAIPVLIGRAVRASQGNLTEAARRLGIAKSTLYAKMERYGLSRHGILSGG